jgi:hypothetical protein
MINTISQTISQQDLNDIKTAIQAIQTKLPFLLGLSEEERKSLLKINNSNKTFSEDVAKELPALIKDLPPRINLPELQKDLALFEQLDQLRSTLEDIVGRITDTQIVAGNEAYIASLDAYRSIANNAKSSVAGAQTAYDKLKTRFEKQGRRKPPPSQN